MFEVLDRAHASRPQAVESGASAGLIGRTDILEATHSTTVRGGAGPGRNAERGRNVLSSGSAGNSALAESASSETGAGASPRAVGASGALAAAAAGAGAGAAVS
jgi:hypothetical protein